MEKTSKTWTVNSNYFKNGKTLTGKLAFESEGFCFKADSVNGKLNLGLIEYEKIKSVDYKKTFGFIPNGLLIVLKDGTEMLFVPLKRKQVKDFLCSKISK